MVHPVLYDLSAHQSESRDLAAAHPDWANRTGVRRGKRREKMK